MYRPLLLCLTVICLMPAGAGVAAVVAVDASGFVAFKHIDSDSNGYVSRVEARSVAGVERVFDSADVNHDGLLNRREYQRARPELPESR